MERGRTGSDQAERVCGGKGGARRARRSTAGAQQGGATPLEQGGATPLKAGGAQAVAGSAVLSYDLDSRLTVAKSRLQ